MSPFRRDTAPGPLSRARDGWAETQVEPPVPPGGWAETRVDPTQIPDGWTETRAQTAVATRLLGDADDYLAASPQDIGRLTGTDVRELFVSCDAAEALQQQFDRIQPEFIAVHDIGARASRQLLLGIAGACGRAVQKLVIRRQGFGNALASLDFVDVPTTGDKPLRIYSTDAEADAAVRPALARTLLGFSRLGVVMVGDVAPAAMESALQPLRDAMATGVWRNRQLLLLPLAGAAALVTHGIALGQVSGVAVRTSPQVMRPADAWGFISASWSRCGDAAAAPAVRSAEIAPMSIAVPAPARDAVVRTPPTAIDRAPELLERYVRQVGEINGMSSCCVFDISTGRLIAHMGSQPDAAQLAQNGGQLMTSIGVASRSLGLGRITPDAAISLGAHHLLLRGVPRHPGLALHAVLDKHVANLTLARLQLQRMDALFEHPG